MASARRARHEVEALEDEPDLAVAQVGEVVLGDVAHVDAVEQVAPGGRRVEAADDVHQRALAAARAAHDGHVLAARDAQRDAGQRAHLDVLAQPVDALDVLQLDDRAARAPRGGQRAHGVLPPPPPARAEAAAAAAAEAAAAEAAARAPPPPRRLPMALLSWSEPPVAAPSAAAVDRTTTLSPAFSPLTTCVVASPTTPVCTRCVSALPSAASTVTVEPLSACDGDGEARDLRGDDVGRGAHPGLEALARSGRA